ncbi:MAG: hypothetical protein K0U37_01570 [Gammaproteobacteria bacterium]|nr:hypothetical protein [Gammaproteobacteria bacterium]
MDSKNQKEHVFASVSLNLHDEAREVLQPYVPPALVISPMKDAIQSGPQQMDESNDGALS